MSEYFDNFEEEYDKVSIKDVGPGNNITVPKSVFIEDLIFSRALFTALERITPILKADSAAIPVLPMEIIVSFDRKFYYFLENAKDGLRKTSERMSTHIIKEGKNKYETVNSVIIHICINIL